MLEPAHAELVADVEDGDGHLAQAARGLGAGSAPAGHPDDGARERQQDDEARAHQGEGEGALARAGRPGAK